MRLLWILASVAAFQEPGFAQATQSATGVSWYMSGRVFVADGMAPAVDATVETFCNGRSYVAARTDKRGDFSFRLGAAGNRSLQDASVGSADGTFGRPPMGGGGAGAAAATTADATAQSSTTTDSSQQTTTTTQSGRAPNERSLAGCDLRFKFPGYATFTLSLANRKVMDNSDLGSIILHRSLPVEGRVVSITNLAAPRNAVKAYDKGRNALRQHKLDEARKNLQKATDIYPKYAAAWTELGKTQVELKQWEAARGSFERAIKTDPQYVDPYLNLAAMEAAQQEWPKLAETTGRAIKLDPYDYPQSYYLNALANYNIHNLDTAEKSAREAEKLDDRRQFPGIRRVLGLILAVRRQYAEAAVQLRAYLQIAPRAPDAPVVRSQLEQVERLSAERGLQTK